MGLFMFAAGVLQIVGGLFAWVAAVSAMGETTAACLVGFGILSLGLGAVIERLPKR